MKPRAAPENGAFVPPSRSRIAGTEPAPIKTSSAVPIASAKARCATENVSITHLLPAPDTRPAGHSAVSTSVVARERHSASSNAVRRTYDITRGSVKGKKGKAPSPGPFPEWHGGRRSAREVLRQP